MSNRRISNFKVSNCNKPRNQRGFTLVEVLISMVVFSLLMVLVSSAMSMATRYWQHENTNLTDRLAEYIYFEKLTNSVASMQPYGVFTRRNDSLSIFFQGTSSEVRFVSDSGFYASGPVIVALRIINTSDLGNVIQVAEEPISRTMLVDIKELEDIEWQWNTIKSNIDNASFRFFGYDNLNQLFIDRSVAGARQQGQKWYDSYSGNERNILPQKIEISWQAIVNGRALPASIDFPVMIDERRRYQFIQEGRYVR